MDNKEATEQAMKIGAELEQKQRDYHRREVLLNMICYYPEHQELVELVREVITSKRIEIAYENVKYVENHVNVEAMLPSWMVDAKNVIDKIDQYDIELKELNKRRK